MARHGATVLRVCRAVLGPDAAEDAWSETFLAALQAYPRLRPDSNVEAWLVTIAHRKALDSARAEARRPVPIENVPERRGVDVTPGDWRSELWLALRALPLRQRQALAYHYVAGLPYAEVAAVVGGSAAAARRAAADGIAALRATYHEAAATELPTGATP